MCAAAHKLAHNATVSASLTGAVRRLPEEVCEGDAAHHDVLLLELDQWLLRYQPADSIQTPEDVQDYPGGPHGVITVLTDAPPLALGFLPPGRYWK
jgi:hypothetical protein